MKKKSEPVKTSKTPYTSKFNEMVLWIADTVYNAGKVRKIWLKDLSIYHGSTFDSALKYLVNAHIVREIIVDTRKDNEPDAKPKKEIYIFWELHQSPDITADLISLQEYQELDLELYPIRDLGILNDDKKAILRKFIFGVKKSTGKYNQYKTTKFFNMLNTTEGNTVTQMTKLLKFRMHEIYYIVNTLIKSDRIQLGVIGPKVAIWKHPDFENKTKYWTCENCHVRNPRKNNYCGKCGDKKL